MEKSIGKFKLYVLKISIDHTFCAARWIVWGMHRIRAWRAENGILAAWQQVSIDSVNVSLLVALSIIIAMILN